MLIWTNIDPLTLCHAIISVLLTLLYLVSKKWLLPSPSCMTFFMKNSYSDPHCMLCFNFRLTFRRACLTCARPSTCSAVLAFSKPSSLAKTRPEFQVLNSLSFCTILWTRLDTVFYVGYTCDPDIGREIPDSSEYQNFKSLVFKWWA